MLLSLYLPFGILRGRRRKIERHKERRRQFRGFVSKEDGRDQVCVEVSTEETL